MIIPTKKQMLMINSSLDIITIPSIDKTGDDNHLARIKES